MQVVLDYVNHILGVWLFVVLLGGCASLPTATEEGSIAPTPVALPTATVHTLRLKQTPRGIALDETHLYWTAHGDKRYIWRYPLTGGEIETVVSTIAGGELVAPFPTSDWLIFPEVSPPSSGGVTWTLRALNLSEGTEQVVIEKTGLLPAFPRPPLFDADGDWVVWTDTRQPDSENCVETILAMRNLRTGEQRELEHACVEDQHVWTAPHLSGNHLTALDKWPLPDSDRSGYNIYLYDLTSGQRTALTDDGHSYASGISGHWMVWKSFHRSTYDLVTVVYDLWSDRRYRIMHDERRGAALAGHWLYWEPYAFNPLYAYDLETRQMFTIATPGENESIGMAAIYNDTIAWSRDPDFEHNDPYSDYLLEWRMLP